MGVGGPIEHYYPISTRQKLTSTAKKVFASGDQWLVLGGGSNLVVSGQGFSGHVLHIQTRGKKLSSQKDGSVLLTVQAGEDWDELVAYTVSEGLSGLESLSGIPGTVGASVIQNIGAYGYEVSDVLDHIELLRYPSAEIDQVKAEELNLGLRTSALKTGELPGIVVSVTFRLTPSLESLPIAYSQVAEALDLDEGQTVPLAVLRKTVLSLRRSKGMVVDPDDPDSRSCGSFFVNPVVTEKFAYLLPADAPKWHLTHSDEEVVELTEGEHFPPGQFDTSDTTEAVVKLSAAWLIEHSGIRKGFQLPGSGARISTKHTLAITNTGSATAEDVATLARYVRTHVANTYGVILQPEPTLIGLRLD